MGKWDSIDDHTRSWFLFDGQPLMLEQAFFALSVFLQVISHQVLCYQQIWSVMLSFHLIMNINEQININDERMETCRLAWKRVLFVPACKSPCQPDSLKPFISQAFNFWS